MTTLPVCRRQQSGRRRPAAGAARGRGLRYAEGAAPGRGRDRASYQGPRHRRHLGAGRRRRRRPARVRRGRRARLVRVPPALQRTQGTPGTPDRDRRRQLHPRGPPARARGRHGRLALPDPGHRALEHQEPTVVRRPGPSHRAAGRPGHDRARRAGARGAGFRRHHRGRPGLVHAATVAPPRVHPGLRQARRPARGDRRQGDHLRQWRPLDQDRRGDGLHEARHERRRRRARRPRRAGRRRLPGPRDRHRGAGGERDLRQRDASRAT